MRKISVWSDRSACGWVAFSSAISSCMRGSEPSLTAASAVGEEVDRAQDLALREPLGLRGEAVAVLGRDGERVGHVAERLHHEQVAQVGGEVAHELGEVASRLGQPLHAEQRLLGVARGQRLAGGEHHLRVRDSEDVEHVVELDLLAAVGHELLERAERVAERAGRGAGEHADRGVGDLDLLLGGHAPHARPRSARARGAGSRSGGSGRRSWPAPCAPRSSRARRPRAAAAPRASSGTRSRPPSRACAPRRGCRRGCRPASARARRSRAARGCRRPSCSTPRPSRPRRARCPPRIARAAGLSGSKSALGPPSAFSAQARSFAIDVLPVPREPTNR